MPHAFSGGWNNVKLYFMLGLPTETDEDVLGIAELVYKVIQDLEGPRRPTKSGGLRVHVVDGVLRAKALHALPVGTAGLRRRSTCRTTAALLKNAMPSKSVEYNWHDAEAEPA